MADRNNPITRKDFIAGFMGFLEFLFKGFCGIFIVCAIIGAISKWVVEPATEQAKDKPPWKLLIHPAVGEPVELALYRSNEDCEADRQDQIRKAFVQHRAIPTLTCASTAPPWLRMLEQLRQKEPSM